MVSPLRDWKILILKNSDLWGKCFYFSPYGCVARLYGGVVMVNKRGDLGQNKYYNITICFQENF